MNTQTTRTTQPWDRAEAQRRARRMRAVNVVLRRVLALPFRTPLSGQLMLLYVTGRRTGKRYRQPVSYIRVEDVLLTPGGGKWTLNLQDGQPVRLRIGGRNVEAVPDLVAGVSEVDSLLMTMAEANPRLTKFVPIPRSADGHFDHDAIGNAVKHGFRIVRWHVASERVSDPGTGRPRR